MARLPRLLAAALLVAVATSGTPLAAAEPDPRAGPLCDRNPLLEGPVSVGQCGDFVRCFVEGEGQFGVYLRVLGFGVLPERPLVYCFSVP